MKKLLKLRLASSFLLLSVLSFVWAILQLSQPPMELIDHWWGLIPFVPLFISVYLYGVESEK